MSSATHPLDLLRHGDRERFVAALFAPPDRRDDLIALYALNVELSRIREQAREPLAGLIRLQWWRDAVLGGQGGDGHPLVGPLRAVIARHRLDPDRIDRLLILRERDFADEPPADLAAAEDLAAAGPVALADLALTLLAADNAANRTAAAAVASAGGLLGHLRALAYHRALGRRTLPEPAEEGLPAQARALADRAAAHLAIVRSQTGTTPAALPLLLPALQAEAHLRALRRAGWNPLDPDLARPRPRPLALTWAAWRRRI
ncbi:MAG: hypothetical protein RLZZ501_1980 [Pseudomonadota bacterium]|jgi:phytoene synthase